MKYTVALGWAKEPYGLLKRFVCCHKGTNAGGSSEYFKGREPNEYYR